MTPSAKPVKIKVKLWGLAVAVLAWLAVTLGAFVVLVKAYDYNVTKADNQLMKAKLALIAEELARGRKYLEMTRTTDMQMRQMLGMPGGKNINNPGVFEEKDEKEARKKDINFVNIFKKKNIEEIDEDTFKEYLGDIEKEAQYRLAAFQDIAWYYANQRNAADFTPSIRPSKGRITSGFGYRSSPFGRAGGAMHNGVDFADKADTPIFVTADGVVRRTGWASAFGQAVLVDHGFGYSTLYAHVTDITVAPGDVVKRGQKIATMGTTGRSTGVHLHYEVWKNGSPVNPRNYFK
jgi:murein DD-endopeptidase MepM/ murein hydrolase activator NlpD